MSSWPDIWLNVKLTWCSTSLGHQMPPWGYIWLLAACSIAFFQMSSLPHIWLYMSSSPYVVQLLATRCLHWWDIWACSELLKIEKEMYLDWSFCSELLFICNFVVVVVVVVHLSLYIHNYIWTRTKFNSNNNKYNKNNNNTKINLHKLLNRFVLIAVVTFSFCCCCLSVIGYPQVHHHHHHHHNNNNNNNNKMKQ